MYALPVILALALYAFYAVGNYRENERRRVPHPHGGIYGTILNDRKQPITGASVTISYTSVKEPVPDAALPTDLQGRFYLADLPAGQYILQATATGYDMQTQRTIVEEGKTVQIKIPLYRTQVPVVIPDPFRKPPLLR